MPKRDRQHFNEYTAQTQAKHAILSAYLPAYLTSLKNNVHCFHYIDGFAGTGHYEGSHPGSPLLALDIISDAGIADRTAMSLVERRPEFAAELEVSVRAHAITPHLYSPPLIRQGRLQDHLQEILSQPIYSERDKTATFAFLDPCGVEGVLMSDMAELLQLPYGEVLLFFNYSAVTRLIGGREKGTHDDRILTELFGSANRVALLVEELQSVKSTSDRERVIREHYLGSLREHCRAPYLVAFRVEARDAVRTSHYIVHCCRNALGFRIMKDVMEQVGRGVSEEYGRLELLRTGVSGSQVSLFRLDIEEQKQAIVQRLQHGPCKVREFTVNWLSKPEDPFSGRAYRHMLLELEHAAQIAVYDKENKSPKPRDKRMRGGKPTLAPDLWLRIA